MVDDNYKRIKTKLLKTVLRKKYITNAEKWLCCVKQNAERITECITEFIQLTANVKSECKTVKQLNVKLQQHLEVGKYE